MWPDLTKKRGSIHPTNDEYMEELEKVITSQPKEGKGKGNVHDPLNDFLGGLSGLINTQHVFIKPSGQPVEIFSSVETKYEVLNSDGEKIFMGDETTDTSTKAWCRGTKPFDVSVLIRSGMYRKEVMKMDGEPRSCGCGGDITLRSPKSTIGTIEHATEWTRPHYFVRDADGRVILEIVGPPSSSCFTFSLEPGGEFNVFLPDGKTLVGKIARYWSRCRGDQERIMLKDIWGVKFPLEMQVTHKALLLAACFLLNFQYQNVE